MVSAEQFARIRVIICDIDGVLTDGRVGYGAPDLIKFFHYRDGHWMKIALRAGLKVGCLSGRKSRANEVRAKELGLSFLQEDVLDKLAGFADLLAELEITPEECMYIGDDLVDLPVMRRVGIAVAVADAMPELDEAAHYRTKNPGGHGAVAEAIRWLLIGQNKLDAAIERYRK